MRLARFQDVWEGKGPLQAPTYASPVHWPCGNTTVGVQGGDGCRDTLAFHLVCLFFLMIFGPNPVSPRQVDVVGGGGGVLEAHTYPH